MELRQLRYFQKVAEMESITLAAKHFLIPQPAMSQTISRLEKELGTTLFDRKSGKLFLNEQGKTFLAHVERMLQELDNGVAAVTEKTDHISGAVRIKVMENHRFILTCVPKFIEQYPDVSVSVSHGYYEDSDIVYDLCVSSGTTYKRMTAQAALIREPVVLAVREDHPLATRKTVSIADLKGQRLISMPAPSSLHAITLELCRSCGFEPQIPIICDDPYFIRKYVYDGMGFALAPALSWEGRFRQNTVLIPIDDPIIEVSSYLLWDQTRYLSPAVCKLREYLLTQAQMLPGNLCGLQTAVHKTQEESL